MATSTPEIMTVDQAAEYLQVVPDTIRRAARDGTLPAAKFGKAWRFRKVDVDDCLSKGGNRRAIKQARLAV